MSDTPQSILNETLRDAPRSFTTYLEASAKAAPLATLLTLLLTLAFESGYFLVIDIQLMPLMGVTDYLRNAAPLFLFAMVVLAFSPMLFELIRRSKLEAANEGNQSPPPRWVFNERGEYTWRGRALIALIPIALATLIAWAISAVALLVIAVPVFMAFNVTDKKSWGPFTATLVVSLALGVAFAFGAATAIKNMKGGSPIEVTSADDKTGKPETVLLLKILDKGLLVARIPNREIEFRKWESIGKVLTRSTWPF
ncbi:hypothetical protein GJW-30_1_03207 [Variibacter gotjawalensis]|uniref:Uncharacterized protein n=2 Tax=Variibacter gotjawalensis TaxID=1333996 RepID=A0A0S3PXL5_9BRAD|nr:hypothetical protein [Variibacter gotjawalensis]NIK46491.1 hypothetical protein [Variibacter gotjawalensis]RZS48399.1 hypothetical protein EV661_0811 [Variibacter gotjawalensis]BAT60658.1 hypothetical protein GJW-30_1_03207 [Variibacter gotjawalensis]